MLTAFSQRGKPFMYITIPRALLRETDQAYSPNLQIYNIAFLNNLLSLRSMASTSTQIVSSSSSSSSTPSWTYDAFLSFYGEDTRKSFTDHLHAALKQKGILVFRDDEKLERGKYISNELLKAIQESMYAIVVISPNYAFSRWCLVELAKIVKCMRDTRLTILPIFYHVDPSHVRNQTGTFAEAFDRHEKDRKVDIDEMQKWRGALKEVGSISGWHVHDRHESKVVEEISRMIFRGLVNFLNVSKGLVGIESRAEEIMSKLCIGLDDVLFLGIHGMGGIGKTALSKFIYERVSHQFEASCFIASIREETRTGYGLVYLQKQLISEILRDREINIWNSYGAIRVIANRLRSKKVLIVLDDVDGEKQLKALAESHDWFGQGSRIIITSRDHHLLNRFVDITYDVKVLNDAEALQLFSFKAFKKPRPEENYVQLSMDIVNYAQGLPLALEVFGSLLFGRTMDEWKSARDLLKENPNEEILDKLKISYDGLEDLQQKMFLDIACFFNGAYIHDITYKLESFGYYPDFNMRVLEDKSLITMLWGRLEMHDLLQKMGQKIVHDESTEPGKRSRLCHDKDVIHILKNDTGTDAVRGIVLKLPLQKPERLNVEAFSKMKKLKMLQISSHYSYKECDNLRTNLEWHGDPSNFILSNELCVMEWWGYPIKSLPTNFQSDNLVELIMRCSCIKQLWFGRNSFDKLRHIDLSDSKNLIETPDLSGVPNLEELMLVCCTSLSKVHPSIGFLRRLKRLILYGCKNLKKLPNKISLESLEHFDLRCCSRFNKIPDSVGNMTTLQSLYLNGTAIKNIPLSFKRLSSLECLDISNCSRLEKISKNIISGMECLKCLTSPITSRLLPNSFSSLSSLILLDLSYDKLSDGAIPSDLSCLSSLEYLNLSGNKFTRIPDSVSQLPHLKELELDNCSWLQVLPKLPLGLIRLSVRNCPSLELFYNQMEMWTSNENLRSIDCSFLQTYIDYDGKPFKILHLHPRSPVWTEPIDYDGKPFNILHLDPRSTPLWTEPDFESFYPGVVCGPPLVGSGIPEWFNNKRTNSFGTIQMHIDLGSDGGYALFIVYEFHKPHTHPRNRRKLTVHEDGNSNSTTFDGGNPNFPYFICQFQANGVDVTKRLVLCAPGVPSVGPNGFWVYIPYDWFPCGILGRWRSFEASITTGNLNVEVKEFGARCVRDEHDASELGLQSYANIFSRWNNEGWLLQVNGPIKSNVVAS